MITIKPFCAFRPQPQLASQVVSPPYDVLSRDEAKQIAAGNPYSFLHITRSEIDLPETVNVYADEVYEKAADNWHAFISRDILFEENKPCLYLYQIKMGDHTQTGIACLSSVADYNNDLIKKHELTRPDKEIDRINHIRKTAAQTGNVFLTYKHHSGIDELVDNYIQKSPQYRVVADDGVEHLVWVMNDDAIIEKLLIIFKNEIPQTYIADGHHRAASAAKVYAEAGSEIPEAAYFLTTLFPDNQLQILSYNRLIKNINNFLVDDFLQSVAIFFTIQTSTVAVEPTQKGIFGMYVKGQWYSLTPKHIPFTAQNNVLDSLDITVLQNLLFAPILGIADQRTDNRVGFVGGIRGTSALQQAVDNSEAQIAFTIFPVTLAELFAVADANEVMPPKSTWFEPKLRDGFVVHLIQSS